MRGSSHTDNNSRWGNLLFIGQAHLEPGMSLAQLQDILTRHGVGKSWAGVTTKTISKIMAEIAAITGQTTEGESSQ